MQRGRGGRGPRGDFFGGGFGDPFGGFGGFGRPGNLIPSFFGGRDPFDDSFFTRPFGGRDPFDDSFFTRPFGGMMGPSMFPPSMFGERSLFGEPSNTGFIEQQPPHRPNRSAGIVIEELNSDGEEEGGAHGEDKKDNPRKHLRSSKEPYVEDPDEETEEKKSKHVQYRNDSSRANIPQPQAHSYNFHSSTVTYGGPNGAYYTSSTTRRTGGDGVTFEESKEADATNRKASHRISRGIHDKGHSVTRKLETDGKVETMQMLHNLNEDELDGFEEVWKGNARQHLPGLNHDFGMLDHINDRNSDSSRQDGPPTRGWALPSTQQPNGSGRTSSQLNSSSGGAYSFNGRSQ